VVCAGDKDVSIDTILLRRAHARAGAFKELPADLGPGAPGGSCISDSPLPQGAVGAADKDVDFSGAWRCYSSRRRGQIPAEGLPRGPVPPIELVVCAGDKDVNPRSIKIRGGCRAGALLLLLVAALTLVLVLAQTAQNETSMMVAIAILITLRLCS